MKDSRYTSRNILEHQGSDHISITLLASSFQLWKQTFCRLHFKFRFLTSSPGLDKGHGDGQVHIVVFSKFSSPLICVFLTVFTHSFTDSLLPTPLFFLQFMEMNQVCDGVIQKRKLIKKVPFPSS